jgi:Tfp pilus assembly protein PilZ
MDNKRQEFRLDNHATVFIEVICASPDSNEPAEMLISNSVDISANGLQITTDRPLLVNSIHEAGIQIDNNSSRLHLITQVRWVKTAPENSDLFKIGLEVLDSEDTSVISWKELLHQKLMDDF